VRLAGELRPDLVILDVKMPKMDGIEAASVIAKDRIAPVVILTAFQPAGSGGGGAPGRGGRWPTWSSRSRSVTWCRPVELAMSRFSELQALENEGSRA